MFKHLIIERIQAIVKKEGGQSMKNTMKWKNVKFKNKGIEIHVADLTSDDFAEGWVTDAQVLDFYDLVNRQLNKAY
jgi:hypothetical protein